MKGRVYSHSQLFEIVKSLLRKYNAERAILFGSYARQEADGDSDIDLVVVGGERFNPTDVFCIADDLHRRTGKNVDVYELCEIGEDSDFFAAILREGVQIE